MNNNSTSLEMRLLSLLHRVREERDEAARADLNALLREEAEARKIMPRLLVDEQALVSQLRDESIVALIERALALGVRKIMVTHPEWYGTVYPVQLQRSLAARGVFFERCFVSTTHRCGFTPFEVIEDAIAAAGVATTVLATDLGQPDTPAPAEGLKLYAERLLASGFTRDDLRRMMCENPRRLLSLDADGAPLRQD